MEEISKLICEIFSCENEIEGGLWLDDLQVCQSCYENAIDMEYDSHKDRVAETSIGKIKEDG